MRWKKYTVETTVEAEDFISEMLSENGIEGIEIEDNVPLSDEDTAEMFSDILPEQHENDGSAKVHFYMNEDEPANVREARLVSIREGLAEIASYTEAGALTIIEGETDEQDWRNNWKQYFHAFKVGDILIRPTWEEDADRSNARYEIAIDPGAAFGTGSHETTRLCITQLRRYIERGDRILDVGTGSGILSIAALKLGASYAMATDLDPQAIDASIENIRQNGFDESVFRVIKGNIIDDPAAEDQIGGVYDIVLANILAPAIIALQSMIFRHIRRGGYFIMSGIIDSKEEDVLAAIEQNPNFEIAEIEHDGEWVAITARRV